MLRIRTEDGGRRTGGGCCGSGSKTEDRGRMTESVSLHPSPVGREAPPPVLGPERSEDPLLARTISKEITLTFPWPLQPEYSLYTGHTFFTPHIWSFFFMSYSFISHQLFN